VVRHAAEQELAGAIEGARPKHYQVGAFRLRGGHDALAGIARPHQEFGVDAIAARFIDDLHQASLAVRAKLVDAGRRLTAPRAAQGLVRIDDVDDQQAGPQRAA